LRYSVQDSLEAGVPFVVTFATPEFCVSRVCGPVVDVVDLVRSEFEETGVRFIQVEIYQDNQPDLGVNQWVAEWNLNSEPWTFLVDGDGIIQGRFEGAFSADELRQAVAEKLPG
ncbi:MAG: TlpA family protein disulfide reductase, partial [Gaiellales bacterium]